MAEGDYTDLPFLLVQLGDGTTCPLVTIKITQTADGVFHFDVTQSGDIKGDLRGIFFDVGGGKDAEFSTSNSSVLNVDAADQNGDDIGSITGASAFQVGNDAVKNLGLGNNMLGALSFNDTGAEAKGYDVGIGFGTPGIATDDVGSVSFDFNAPFLTLDDFIGMDFGVRMTSVGTLDGPREELCKLTNTSFQPVEDRELCFDGLSPEFWAQHTDGWDGYSTDDSFESLFGMDINWPQPPTGPTNDLTDPTLLQALGLEGGDEFALAREAVGAILNANSVGDGLTEAYRFFEFEIFQAVQLAFGLFDNISGNENVYNAALGAQLTDVLEYWNRAHYDEENAPFLADGVTPNPDYNPDLATPDTDDNDHAGVCFDSPEGENPQPLIEVLGWGYLLEVQ